MEMIKLLDSYIERLDVVIDSETKEKEALIEDITRVILSQDELRELYLDYYNDYSGETDLKSDIRKLRAKLIYRRADIVDEQEKTRQKEAIEHEQREVEKLRLQLELQKGGIIIHNSNTNENNNTISVSFDDARRAVDNMTSLSDDEIQETKKRIDELEDIIKSAESKGRKWAKAKEIVKWVADKGVDVGIAILPLLLQIK